MQSFSVLCAVLASLVSSHGLCLDGDGEQAICDGLDSNMLQLKVGTQAASALPAWLELSSARVDAGELVVNYYNGAPRPSGMSFADGQMRGEEVFIAWGFTKEAWQAAGLTDLNGAWTMRYDFTFPDDGQGFQCCFRIFFDKAKSQVGQTEDFFFPLEASRDLTAPGFGSDFEIKHPTTTTRTASLLTVYDKPFSWLISRDGATGYITVKLYDRSTSELLVEIEGQREKTFSNDVPVGFYLNQAWADWQAVGLVSSSNVPSISDTYSAPVASVVGDPHVVNVLGTRFEIRKPGRHLMLSLPRDAAAGEAWLLVHARMTPSRSDCGPMFMRELGIMGKWLGDVPGVTFSAGAQGQNASQQGGAGLQVGSSGLLSVEELQAALPASMLTVTLPPAVVAPPARANQHATAMQVALSLGPGVAVKVSWVTERTPQQELERSLWASVSGLSAAGAPAGGLLGTGSHDEAARPPPQCSEGAALLGQPRGDAAPARLIATASEGGEISTPP